MVDTLKTTGAGIGGFWIAFIETIPELISILVGLATLIYLIIKIAKEFEVE